MSGEASTEPASGITPSIAEASERSRRYLEPVQHDVFMTVLKGHLLLEQSINEYLEVALPYSKKILSRDGPGSFHVKLDIMEAVAPVNRGFICAMIEAMRSLNTARNEMVHYLDSPNADKKLASFIGTGVINPLARLYAKHAKEHGMNNKDGQSRDVAFALSLTLSTLCDFLRMERDRLELWKRQKGME